MRNRTLRSVLRSMANTNWKSGRPSPVEHIGKVLRDLIEGLGRKPLPERWTQLIERLNAEEDALNERTRRGPAAVSSLGNFRAEGLYVRSSSAIL